MASAVKPPPSLLMRLSLLHLHRHGLTHSLRRPLLLLHGSVLPNPDAHTHAHRPDREGHPVLRGLLLLLLLVGRMLRLLVLLLEMRGRLRRVGRRARSVVRLRGRGRASIMRGMGL